MTYLLSKNYEDKIPTVLQDPYIDGLAEVGRTLTCRHFALGATSVTYQWYADNEATGLASQIVGATNQTLVLVSNYLEKHIGCRVTFTNDQGSVVRFSDQTVAVAQAPSTDPNEPTVAPVFDTEAAITGTAQVGRTLSATYAVTGASSVAFQWYRDIDGDGATAPVAITNATLQSYVLQPADEGYQLRVVVTASNSVGDTPSTSQYTAAVAAVDNTIPGDAIAVDSAWFAATANGGPSGPWVMNKPNGYYYLTENVTVDKATYIANANITLDLNGYTFTRSGVVTSGTVIRGYISGHDSLAIPSGNPYSLASWKDATIKNGTIRNDVTRPDPSGVYTYAAGPCVNARRSYGTILSNLVLVSNQGYDARCVHYEFDETSTAPSQIVDSVLYCRSLETANRHLIPACVKAEYTNFYIARCAILGGNTGIHCGDGSLIESNLISQLCFATNGWGVNTYKAKNIVVRNNVILPVNGRGVFFDSDGANSCTAHDNIILAWEAPNAEFSDNLDPSAFKARYNVYNHRFYNNDILVVGGRRTGQPYSPTWSTGDSITITNQPRLTAGWGISLNTYSFPIPTPNEFYNNTIRAIYMGDLTDNQRAAAPISWQGPRLQQSSGAASTDLLYNNDCYSNDYMISHNAFDGWGRVKDAMTGNSFTWQTGSEAYTAFTAAIDAAIAACGFSTAVQAAVDTRVTYIKSRLSDYIVHADTARTARSSFWEGDHGVDSQFPNNSEFIDIVDSTFGTDVDPTTWNRYEAPITRNRFVLRVGATHTLQLLDNGTPIASATVTVTPDQIDTYETGLFDSAAERPDTTTTTTGPDGTCTIQYWQYSLTRPAAGGVPTVTTGTSSTISVDGVGSKSVAHASLGATLDLTA